MTKKRQQTIDKLAEAITDYLFWNPPKYSTRPELRKIADRHGVNPKSLYTAIHIMSQTGMKENQ